MIKPEDEIVQKSDDAKGENTAHSKLDKVADEAAKKAQKTEQRYDKQNDIFTK
jgi:hypothetical protein